MCIRDSPEGGKTQLGQSGDRLVLEESLAWSDGILMAVSYTHLTLPTKA